MMNLKVLKKRGLFTYRDIIPYEITYGKRIWLHESKVFPKVKTKRDLFDYSCYYFYNVTKACFVNAGTYFQERNQKDADEFIQVDFDNYLTLMEERPWQEKYFKGKKYEDIYYEFHNLYPLISKKGRFSELEWVEKDAIEELLEKDKLVWVEDSPWIAFADYDDVNNNEAFKGYDVSHVDKEQLDSLDKEEPWAKAYFTLDIERWMRGGYLGR